MCFHVNLKSVFSGKSDSNKSHHTENNSNSDNDSSEPLNEKIKKYIDEEFIEDKKC